MNSVRTPCCGTGLGARGILGQLHFGIRGLASFLARLLSWRMSVSWWLVLLVGMPAVFYAGGAINGTLDDPFPFNPWSGVLPALLAALSSALSFSELSRST